MITKIQKESYIAYREIDSEVVILNLETSEYFTLNETASEIWKLMIEKKYDIQKTAKYISEKYSITTEEALKDTENFINNLIKYGVIKNVEKKKK